jgi:TfoX N-terminal domain
MAYDEDLADRLRLLLSGEQGISEQRMFGGLAFLAGGHLAIAASGAGGLLVRCDPAATAALVEPPDVDRFEMRGRQMDGWLRVDAGSVESDEALRRWADIGTTYARSLPPK